MKKLLAIDPGASGGLAWTFDDHVQCMAMPKTQGEVFAAILTMLISGIDEAIIEQVGGYCGGAGAPGSAMFNFGEGYGFIQGVLMARRVRIVLVRPQKWQKHFSLGTTKSAGGKTQWKNKLKAEAERRFPNADVTLKTADALLLWEYGQTI